MWTKLQISAASDTVSNVNLSFFFFRKKLEIIWILLEKCKYQQIKLKFKIKEDIQPQLKVNYSEIISFDTGTWCTWKCCMQHIQIVPI